MALPPSRSGYAGNARQVWMFRTIRAEPTNAFIVMDYKPRLF